MLGGEPILTRDGGTLVDGHGHRPYVTTAGSAPSLGKHVLLAYLPPDRGARRQRARGVLHGGALPGDRRLGRRHAAVRPRQRADPVAAAWTERAWSASSGCPTSPARSLLTDDGQGVDARHVGYTVSPHEECAVELAIQIAKATGGEATVLTRRLPRTPSSSCATRWRVGCTAAILVEADPRRLRPGRRGRGESPTSSRAHEAAGTTYDLVLLGNDAADTGDFQVGIRLAYALDRPVVTGVSTVEVGRRRPVDRARRRPRRRTRPSRSRCPRSSRCWRAASSRATRSSRAG